MTPRAAEFVFVVALTSALGCAKVSWRGAHVVPRTASVKGRVLGTYVSTDFRDSRGQPLDQPAVRVTVRERGGRQVLVESRFAHPSLVVTASEVVGRARLFQARTFDERRQVLTEYFVFHDRTEAGFLRLTPSFSTRSRPLGPSSVPEGPAAVTCRLEPVP